MRSKDSKWREENMSDEDINFLVEYTAQVQELSAKRERQAIVAWLRDSGAAEDDAVADAVEAIGNSIEHGDHLGADDE